MKSYRFFPLVTAVFVTALIVSNIIAVKQIEIGPFKLTAALLIFSISYIFGDVLTEVYGYAKARQVIWIGFGCNLLAVAAFVTAGMLPASSTWVLPGFSTPQASQSAYDAVLGYTPLILLASFAAYLAGEFLNSFVLAKMKVATQARWLWMRTIGTTLVGQLADSAVFITAAFVGIWPGNQMLPAVLTQWLLKSGYETLVTPLTYIVVAFLKRAEREDYFDYHTDFNPLKFGTGQ